MRGLLIIVAVVVLGLVASYAVVAYIDATFCGVAALGPQTCPGD